MRGRRSTFHRARSAVVLLGVADRSDRAGDPSQRQNPNSRQIGHISLPSWMYDRNRPSGEISIGLTAPSSSTELLAHGAAGSFAAKGRLAVHCATEDHGASIRKEDGRRRRWRTAKSRRDPRPVSTAPTCRFSDPSARKQPACRWGPDRDGVLVGRDSRAQPVAGAVEPYQLVLVARNSAPECRSWKPRNRPHCESHLRRWSRPPGWLRREAESCRSISWASRTALARKQQVRRFREVSSSRVNQSRGGGRDKLPRVLAVERGDQTEPWRLSIADSRDARDTGSACRRGGTEGKL